MPAALSARLGHEAAVAWEDVLEAGEVLVIQTLRKEMQELRTELRAGMQDLRGEMQALRADLKASAADTRADLTTLVAANRAELQTLVADNRAELRAMVADTRADLMKWSLLFWVSQIAVLLALVRALSILGRW